MISGIRTHIFIGRLEIVRAPRVWIESERHKPVTSAGITIPDPAGEISQVVKIGDAVEIRYGFRDEDPAIWKGTVRWARPVMNGIEIGAAGVELPLSATRITQSWEEETPEAIIRWAVARAGMAVGRIDSPGVVIPRYVASNISVWQAARQCAHTCQKSFGIDMSRWALWVDPDGKVCWGDFDFPGNLFIATGAGLIRHSPSSDQNGWNLVETFLAAGFTHSMTFRITDTRRDIDGEFRALRVQHNLDEAAARTKIWYGEEHGRY